MAGTRRTVVRWVNVYLHPILHIETMLNPRESSFLNCEMMLRSIGVKHDQKLSFKYSNKERIQFEYEA